MYCLSRLIIVRSSTIELSPKRCSFDSIPRRYPLLCCPSGLFGSERYFCRPRPGKIRLELHMYASSLLCVAQVEFTDLISTLLRVMHSLLCCRVLLNLQRAGSSSRTGTTLIGPSSSRSGGGGGVFTTLAFSDETQVASEDDYEMVSPRRGDVEDIVAQRTHPQPS
jgi:hypothetical protein